MRKANIDLAEGTDVSDYLANGKIIKDEKKVETYVISGLAIWDTPYNSSYC